MGSVNIEPIVRAYAGQDDAKLRAITRVAHAIGAAAISGPSFSHPVRPEDFREFFNFMGWASIDVAFADLKMSIDDRPDRQESKDGYGVLDWDKL